MKRKKHLPPTILLPQRSYPSLDTNGEVDQECPVQLFTPAAGAARAKFAPRPSGAQDAETLPGQMSGGNSSFSPHQAPRNVEILETPCEVYEPGRSRCRGTGTAMDVWLAGLLVARPVFLSLLTILCILWKLGCAREKQRRHPRHQGFHPPGHAKRLG